MTDADRPTVAPDVELDENGYPSPPECGRHFCQECGCCLACFGDCPCCYRTGYIDTCLEEAIEEWERLQEYRATNP